jgi:TRAP-type C4-dicarboxylate transport system permease small subunit
MNTAHLHRLTIKSLQLLLVVIMACLALDVLWQIITRFIIGDPSVWTEELARYLLIWLGALGAALGVGEGFHLEMDYFLQKAKPAARKQMDRIIILITALVALTIFMIGGGRLVLLAHQLEQTSAALAIPMSWVYAALPLSGLLMLGFCLQQLRHPTPHTRLQSAID